MDNSCGNLHHMRAIQLTIDEDLLERVDDLPEVRSGGRSAFIRKALAEALKRRREDAIAEAYRRGYAEHPVAKDEFESEQEHLAWPDE